MKNSGFTLIEVIVAMSIISIMAGILVPMSYRLFEAQETEVTRSRMMSLKTAMVGNPELYQQGIRTDYGFVGDNGELPETLSDLITASGSYANWHGPYLSAGFDPATYARDAWGEALVYTPTQDALSRRVSATLISKGPDRTLSTPDDLDVVGAAHEQIGMGEVTPTNAIEGNLSYVISVYNTAVIGDFSVAMSAVYHDFDGLALTAAACAPVAVGLVQKTVPLSSSVYYSSLFPDRLPVGKVVLKNRWFSNATCSEPALSETAGTALFVSQGLNVMYFNPPIFYHYIANGP